MDKNRGIGIRNQLPWHLPEDLRHFKNTTNGHSIVMGRKTYESIGKPLPDRQNYVLSNNSSLSLPSEVIVTDPSVILSKFQGHDNPEVFIIGGSAIYDYFLPYADKLYVTELDEVFECDAYFPLFSLDEWEQTKKVKGIECGEFDYYFTLYERRHAQ